MQPGTAPPTPPKFKPRRQIKAGYYMSISVGWFGQVLFLGAWFGGGGWYAAAAGAAAFAEVVMSASGNASLDHRVHGRAWKLMLVLSLTVAGYAAANQLLHWHDKPALAITFAGASVVGFFLHLLDGHIRAAAYLRTLAQWESAQAAAAIVTVVAPQPRAARQAAPRTLSKPIEKTSEPAVEAKSALVEEAEQETKPAAVAKNVMPISEGLSQRERVWRWFVEQVNAANGDVYAVKGADLVEQFGSEHLKKKISDLRRRYENEFGDAAVNE